MYLGEPGEAGLVGLAGLPGLDGKDVSITCISTRPTLSFSEKILSIHSFWLTFLHQYTDIILH